MRFSQVIDLQFSVIIAMKRKLAATSSGGEQAGSYGEQVAISDLRAELAGAAKGSKMSIARVLAILKKTRAASRRSVGRHQ